MAGLYEMNQCDIVIANSMDEAKQFYLKETGLPAEQAFDGDEPVEISRDAMRGRRYHWMADARFSEETVSMDVALGRWLDMGERVPSLFYSTDI